MEKKYLYSVSGVSIILSAWMLFADDTGKCGIGAILLGISGVIFTYLSVRNTKWKRVIATQIIGLIILTVLFLGFLPTYTYKEAVAKVENETGEKMIQTKEIKRAIDHYIIYTKEDTYLFNMESGNFVKRITKGE
ncbi:hypothetical protein ACIQYS_08225 [Psychrobacillus sp. NPDC096426]|uniref:hypothetical protein n=1 Tax=Psychrobacillus sp. NPDC096426 TaxID=3364491 RepID=UPI0037F1785D